MRDEIRERIEAVRRGEMPEGYVVRRPYLIPKSWQVRNMGELSNCTSRPNNDEDTRPIYSISNQRGFVPQNEQFGDGSYGELDKSSYKVVRRGEFAYNPARVNVGSIGRLIDADEAAVSSLYVCIALNESIDGDYFDNWIATPAFIKEVIRNTEGSVREYLFYDNFARIRIPVPPLREQRRITELLDTCNQAIRLKQQPIDEEHKLKHSLSARLLIGVDMRLPGFESISKKTVQLVSLVDSIDAGTSVNSIEAETVQYSTDRPFVLKTSCVSNGAFIPSEIKEVTEQDYGRVSCPVKAGTLIVSRMNTPSLVGACAYCDSSKDNIFLPDRLWRVTLKTSVDGRWLNYLLNTSAYQDRLHLLASGTSNSMKNISKEDFLGLQIEVPSLEEQKAIAKVLMCLDQSIEALERELEQWQQKKKALMQLLLTGLVRVNA